MTTHYTDPMRPGYTVCGMRRKNGQNPPISRRDTVDCPQCEGHPACKSNQGRHVCLTHEYTAPNDLDADGHAATPGEHRMAWWCAEHNRVERY